MKRLFDVRSPFDREILSRLRIRIGKDEWVHDVFPIDIETRRTDTPAFTKPSITTKHIRVASVCAGIFFCIIAFRVLWLQVFRGEYYSHLALKNTERSIPIPASRGTVIDRKGRALTVNIPKFSLVMVSNDIPRNKQQRETLAERVANLSGVSSSTMLSLLSSYASYRFESVTLLEDLPFETALRLDVASSDMPGIHVIRGSKRKYVDPFSAAQSSSTIASLSHILGYTGALSRDELDKLHSSGYIPSDTIGKTGIEQSQEKALRGIFGQRKISVDAVGKEQQVLSISAPIPGMHVRLTIDAAMQKQMEKLLQEQLLRIGARRASAVVMNPKNGEILALVSLPAYNNNDFSGGISSKVYSSYIENEDHPLFNRAIAGTFPSGSTIKPLIATAALEEGLVTPQTKIFSSGGLHVGEWFFRDWKVGGHGPTDLDESLDWSVNTYYYTIGGGYMDREGLGIDRIRLYLSRFGFTSTTGIDIAGEAKGFLPSKEWKKEQTGEQWYVGDTYNVSIGQGDVLVTPLQIAYSTGLIANNGTGYSPHLTLSLVDVNSGKEESVPPRLRDKNLFSSASLSAVRHGMYTCVSRGSCASLRGLPFAAAAKTGTAQWREGKKHFAWFTSFAPYDNPSLVVTVLIEEGGEGGIVSAPVVRDFYAWWWQYMQAQQVEKNIHVDNALDNGVIL